MANIKSAIKRARQTVGRRARNFSHRSMMRTMIKKVLHAIEAKDAETANAAYRKMTSVLDSYATKGLIHKNKAARCKSRVSKKLKALA